MLEQDLYGLQSTLIDLHAYIISFLPIDDLCRQERVCQLARHAVQEVEIPARFRHISEYIDSRYLANNSYFKLYGDYYLNISALSELRAENSKKQFVLAWNWLLRALYKQSKYFYEYCALSYKYEKYESKGLISYEDFVSLELRFARDVESSDQEGTFVYVRSRTEWVRGGIIGDSPIDVLEGRFCIRVDTSDEMGFVVDSNTINVGIYRSDMRSMNLYRSGLVIVLEFGDATGTFVQSTYSKNGIFVASLPLLFAIPKTKGDSKSKTLLPFQGPIVNSIDYEFLFEQDESCLSK